MLSNIYLWNMTMQYLSKSLCAFILLLWKVKTTNLFEGLIVIFESAIFLFWSSAALAEASVIVREHAPLTNLLMCLWFNEVVRFTSLDQLSFPYVLRQLRVLKNVNFFPVCTRNDLVSSMGHKRKARTTLLSQSFHLFSWQRLFFKFLCAWMSIVANIFYSMCK